MHFFKILVFLQILGFFVGCSHSQSNTSIRSTDSKTISNLIEKYNTLKNSYEKLLRSKGGGGQKDVGELKLQASKKDNIIRGLEQKNLELTDKYKNELINVENKLNAAVEKIQGKFNSLLETIQQLEIFKDFDIEDIVEENIEDRIKEFGNLYKKDIERLNKVEEGNFKFSTGVFSNKKLNSFLVNLQNYLSTKQQPTGFYKRNNNNNYYTVDLPNKNTEIDTFKKKLQELQHAIKCSKIFDGYNDIDYNVTEQITKAFCTQRGSTHLLYVSLNEILDKIQNKVNNKNIDTSIQNSGKVVSPILDKIFRYVESLETLNNKLNLEKKKLKDEIDELKKSQIVVGNLPYYAVLDMCSMMNILYNKGAEYLKLLENVILILNSQESISIESNLHKLFKRFKKKGNNQQIDITMLNYFSEEQKKIYDFRHKEESPTYISEFSPIYYKYLVNGFSSYSDNIYSPLITMNSQGKENNYKRSNKKDTNFTINTLKK